MLPGIAEFETINQFPPIGRVAGTFATNKVMSAFGF